MPFDSTRLVAQITIKGSLPDGRFTDQELLDLAYDSLLSEIVPMILEAREDYFVTYLDLPITANKSAYPVPTRALNGILREVKLIRGSSIINLERKDLEEITSSTTGTPSSFYVMGNDVVLHPTPDTTVDTLRLYYFIRPSQLVPVSSCGRITAIVGSTVSISIPTGWTTANTFDLVRGSAHFDVLAIDLAASSVASGSVVFTRTVPSTLAVGDYVTLANETCFPFLPPEGHVALVQSAVTSALESIGDPAASVSAQKSEMLKKSFQSVLKTRIQGEAKAFGARIL